MVTGRIKAITLVGVLAMSTPGLASAADAPKEGNFDQTACYSLAPNAIPFGANTSIGALDLTGTILSTPPGGILDKASFHCLGLRTTIDGKTTFSIYCVSVVADGSKVLTKLVGLPDGTMKQEAIAGMGRFEGIEMSGTVSPMGQFPTAKSGIAQSCNRQTGTYKLK